MTLLIVLLSVGAYLAIAGLMWRSRYVHIKDHGDYTKHDKDGLLVLWGYGSLFWPVALVISLLVVFWKKFMLAPTPGQKEAARTKAAMIAAEKFLKLQIQAGFSPSKDDLAAVGGRWIDNNRFVIPSKLDGYSYGGYPEEYTVTDEGISESGRYYQ